MNNTKTITDGVALARTIIRNKVLLAIEQTAYDLLTQTDVPVWTHNLWDSIGCGIYDSGTLVQYAVPPKGAVDPRSGADDYPPDARKSSASAAPLWNVPNGVDRDKSWWGQDELFDMLNYPPESIASMTSGFALYYVAAMPYAEVIDRKVNVTQEQRMAPIFFQHIKKL